VTAWPRWRAARRCGGARLQPAAAAPALAQAGRRTCACGAQRGYADRPGPSSLLAEPWRWRDVARLNRLADPNRIPVGARLRFPLAWMRSEPRPATLLGSVGSVQAPTRLDEGSELVTGTDGHAIVRLVDGTLLRLRPGSRLALSESRVVPDTPVARARARLGSGRVEVEAAPAATVRPVSTFRRRKGCSVCAAPGFVSPARVMARPHAPGARSPRGWSPSQDLTRLKGATPAQGSA
jgi:hypothetical protein